MLQPDFIFEPAAVDVQATNGSPVNNVKMSINDVHIKRKRDLLNRAEVFILSIVADNVSAEPVKITTTDIFENVRNGDRLPLGPAGLTIYRNDPGKIPYYLDYRILVVESDKRSRELGAIVSEVQQDEEFKKVVAGILALTTVSGGTAALLASATVLVVGLVAKAMMLNKDDQLLLIQGSYDQSNNLGVVFNEVVGRSRFAEVKYQTMPI